MASWLRVFYLVVLVMPGLVFADPAQFDLAGPKLEVKVIHAGKPCRSPRFPISRLAIKYR
jgi:hypothetical protein